jgi:molybdopterin converting factor small subunit
MDEFVQLRIPPNRCKIVLCPHKEVTVARVRLEVVPWLTRAFGVAESGRFVKEEEVDAGTTVRELFDRLATQYQGFAEFVFDRDSRELTGLVSVIFNDRVVEMQGGLDATITDGDTIILLPAYAGGSNHHSK